MKTVLSLVVLLNCAALAGAGERAAATNAAPARGAPLASLDGARIRTLAAEAIRQKYPGLDLAAFSPGYTLYMEDAASGSPGVAISEWLGKETLATEKGKAPERDRRKVRKLRVRLAQDGRLLEVVDTVAWIVREAPSETPPPTMPPAKTTR